MSTRSLLTAGILATALATGCIPSLHPIYTDDTLADCSGLIGHWQSQDGNQFWRFSAPTATGCQLEYTDNQSHQGTFDVRLTDIGDQQFMDLSPRPVFGQNTAGFYKQHWVKTHTFYRIALTSDSLSLAFLNPNWMKAYLAEHPDELAFEQYGESSVLLTADTDELRRFVRGHRDTANAFSEPLKLTRVGQP